MLPRCAELVEKALRIGLEKVVGIRVGFGMLVGGILSVLINLHLMSPSRCLLVSFKNSKQEDV